MAPEERRPNPCLYEHLKLSIASAAFAPSLPVRTPLDKTQVSGNDEDQPILDRRYVSAKEHQKRVLLHNATGYRSNEIILLTINCV
jgi:hypothetical protein